MAMSESQTEMLTEINEPENADECLRCGAESPESKMAYAANYDTDNWSWCPICIDCLESLGEWWRSSDGDADE